MRGQMALPVIILISGIIMEIAIAIAFVSHFASTSGLGDKLSVRALSVAQAGIRDASIKIARDKNFVPSPNPYNLTVGDDTVSISVEKNPGDLPTGSHRVTATAVAGSRQRRLVGILSVDATTGKVITQSIKEEAIP